jgi:hypothetical protein
MLPLLRHHDGGALNGNDRDRRPYLTACMSIAGLALEMHLSLPEKAAHRDFDAGR